MEGFRADQEYKGGYTPIRIKLLVITCPRPPCDMIVDGVNYPGEFTQREAHWNGSDRLEQRRQWEDVAQVVERIRESGGKMVCFTKTVVEGVATQYHQRDVTWADPRGEQTTEFNQLIDGQSRPE